MLKPRALRPGDRVAVIAPASPFARESFDAGIAELRRLEYEPVYEESVFARRTYTAGDAALRAAAFRHAWLDDSVSALIAVRGGYGSVQLLPLLDPADMRRHPKAFVGYSDNTSLLGWLNGACGIVAFHGPMLDGRFAKGESAYDRDTFTRVLTRPQPANETHPQLRTLRAGEAGVLLRGTPICRVAPVRPMLDPPAGFVLFIGEVPSIRTDRSDADAVEAAGLSRAPPPSCSAMPHYEPVEKGPAVKAVVADLLADHRSVLFGLPSGHTDVACMTLPFGVRAKAQARQRSLKAAVADETCPPDRPVARIATLAACSRRGVRRSRSDQNVYPR